MAELSAEEAQRTIHSCQDALGIPCEDPIRNQADPFSESFLIVEGG